MKTFWLQVWEIEKVSRSHDNKGSSWSDAEHMVSPSIYTRQHAKRANMDTYVQRHNRDGQFKSEFELRCCLIPKHMHGPFLLLFVSYSWFCFCMIRRNCSIKTSLLFGILFVAYASIQEKVMSNSFLRHWKNIVR